MMKADYEKLKRQLSHKPIILADDASGEVRLISHGDAVERLRGDAEASVMANIGRSLERFHQLAENEGKSEFDLHDVCRVAGLKYTAGHLWMRQGIVTPSIRKPSGSGRGAGPLFSFADLFVAGVCGMLRRQGVGQKVLKKVGPLFETTPKKKKRTTRRLAPAEQS